ncbi:MAG TPA: hypothetical protein VE136_11125 [Anaerolineales bacterium]|nr:hypothetical protein [Anaerolineales bacterium]
MKLLIGAVLVIHGLITAFQSGGSFGSTPSSGLQNPSWVNWWQVNLGRSWLLSWLGLERTPVTWIGGMLWLVGGIALAAAGLGVLGFIIPTEWWRSLAIAGAAISLFMLVVYFHPLTIIGGGLSLAILVALLWAHWPPANLVP